MYSVQFWAACHAGYLKQAKLKVNTRFLGSQVQSFNGVMVNRITIGTLAFVFHSCYSRSQALITYLKSKLRTGSAWTNYWRNLTYEIIVASSYWANRDNKHYILELRQTPKLVISLRFFLSLAAYVLTFPRHQGDFDFSSDVILHDVILHVILRNMSTFRVCRFLSRLISSLTTVMKHTFHQLGGLQFMSLWTKWNFSDFDVVYCENSC